MKFYEALAILDSGLPVIHEKRNLYLTLIDGMIYQHTISGVIIYPFTSRDLFSGGWEVPQEGHDITWAIAQIRDGYRVRHRSWAKGGYWDEDDDPINTNISMLCILDKSGWLLA